MIKEYIKNLIGLYDAYMAFMHEDFGNPTLRLILLDLIKNLAAIELDIRSCSKKSCPCSPEKNIVSSIQYIRPDIILIANHLQMEENYEEMIDEMIECVQSNIKGAIQ